MISLVYMSSVLHMCGCAWKCVWTLIYNKVLTSFLHRVMLLLTDHVNCWYAKILLGSLRFTQSGVAGRVFAKFASSMDEKYCRLRLNCSFEGRESPIH